VSAALGVAAFKSLYYLGIELTTALNASILGPTLPIMIAALAWAVLGERMNAIQLVGVGITIVGVMLVSAQGRLDLLVALRLNAGDMLILAAFAAMAVYTIILRKSPTALSAWVFVTVLFVLATAMLIPFYLMELGDGTHPAIPWKHAWAVLYIGIVTYIFGLVFWNLAVARLGATLPAMSVFLIPVFGTILATWFLGEVMGWYHYAGLAFTVIGVLLAVTNAETLRGGTR
jgi:drug/metabolite transporter (DMT)-like permease